MTRKIAFFLVSLNGGGAEKVFVTLANSFANLGFRVDLIVGKPGGAYLKEVSSDVNIVNLNRKRAIECLFPLAGYMRLQKPDVLYTTMNYLNILGIVANLIAGMPTKLVVREAATLTENLKLTGRLVRFFFPFLIKALYPFATSVVCVSEGVKQDLELYLWHNKKNLTVIVNPIEFGKISGLANAKPEHPWLGGDIPVVIAVGRLSPEKDYETLIKAFAKVLEKRSARLIILGEGPERSRLEDLVLKLKVKASVQLVGFVENPFVFMKMADLYVLSSNQEGMPNSLLQATILGCKVISTDCKSGPSEILENGRYGLLVPIGDSTILANAILSQIEAPRKQPLLSLRAKYCASKIAQEYLNAAKLDFPVEK